MEEVEEEIETTTNDSEGKKVKNEMIKFNVNDRCLNQLHTDTHTDTHRHTLITHTLIMKLIGCRGGVGGGT